MLAPVLLLALCASTLVSPVAAVAGLVGACKAKNYTAAPIELDRYLGKWYEIAHSESFYWDRNCFCTTAEYSLNTDSTVKVDNQCRLKSTNGEIYGKIGTGRIKDTRTPGQITVNFGVPFANAPYTVVDFDPEYQWAMVVSCSSFPVFGGSLLWILGRDPVMDPVLYNTLVARFVRMGFDTSDLIPTVQEGCPGLPVSDSTVESSGSQGFRVVADLAKKNRCDVATSETSFSLPSFSGDWYLIETQPDLVENFFTRNCYCSKSTFNVFEDGTGEAVQSCRKSSVNGQYSEIRGGLRSDTVDRLSTGIFIQDFNGVPEQLQVLAHAQDYSSALLSNCLDFTITKSYCLYIMSREPYLSAEAVSYYKSVAKSAGLLKTMKTIQQEGCW